MNPIVSQDVCTAAMISAIGVILIGAGALLAATVVRAIFSKEVTARELPNKVVPPDIPEAREPSADPVRLAALVASRSKIDEGCEDASRPVILLPDTYHPNFMVEQAD